LSGSDKQTGSIPIRISGSKELGADKMARNKASFDADAPRLRKPPWIRVRLPSGNAVGKLKSRLRERDLVTVCEEASCPNIHECFSKGTATFMILGEVCTRRCSFCDVAHGRPLPPDAGEPAQLAGTVRDMKLRYIVITSVDRDDLRDGGAGHFAECIRQVRALNRGIRIEVLVPDFRGKGKIERALDILSAEPPDVFNHNIETVKPDIPTKSGIMLGLGESREQVEQALRDLREHDVDMITLGQYLQPTPHHHPVLRYWTPREFDELADFGYELGFTHMASGPLVRSSYHADQSAEASGIVPDPVDE